MEPEYDEYTEDEGSGTDGYWGDYDALAAAMADPAQADLFYDLPEEEEAMAAQDRGYGAEDYRDDESYDYVTDDEPEDEEAPPNPQAVGTRGGW